MKCNMEVKMLGKERDRTFKSWIPICIAALIALPGFTCPPEPAPTWWEIRICDNATCTGCVKTYRNPDLQIEIAELAAEPWDSTSCPGTIGANLHHIDFTSTSWRVEAYEKVNFSGHSDLRVPVTPGAPAPAWETQWTPPVPAVLAVVNSLVLIGPAARFCREPSCETWADLPELTGVGECDPDDRLRLQGRIARKTLPASVTAPTHPYTHFQYWRGEFLLDPAAPTPIPLRSGIAAVKVRGGLVGLAICRQDNYVDCYRGRYLTGTAIALPSDWSWRIRSFDLIRSPYMSTDPPYLPESKGLKIVPANWDDSARYGDHNEGPIWESSGHIRGTCGALGGFDTQPEICDWCLPWLANCPPSCTSCTSHADCDYPYSCTDRGCRLAACFDWVSKAPGIGNDDTTVNVYYRPRMAADLKHIVGGRDWDDLVAQYAPLEESACAGRLRDWFTYAAQFVSGRYTGSAAENSFALADPWSGDPVNDFQVDVIMWPKPYDGSPGSPGTRVDYTYGMVCSDSGKPYPFALDPADPGQKRYRLREAIHEYGHLTHSVYFPFDWVLHEADGGDLDGRGFGGDGVTEGGFAEQFKECLVSGDYTNDDIPIIYQETIQQWPRQTFCREWDGILRPDHCRGLEFSDMPVYRTFDAQYDALQTWHYIGSQFMTKAPGGGAVDPRMHSLMVGVYEMFRPLQYMAFWKSVADELHSIPGVVPDSQQIAWINALDAVAARGDWVRCVDDDPSQCPPGAGIFEDSSSFDTAFRRWARTYFLTPNFRADPERSSMDLKMNIGSRDAGLGGARGAAGGGVQRLVDLPFWLDANENQFTIVITAEVGRDACTTAVADCDGVVAYVDSDDALGWPGGVKFGHAYAPGSVCWAFGHDSYPGTANECTYPIGADVMTDGSPSDPGATMRFIPSNVISRFAAGATPGWHHLYVDVLNQGIVYSVEVYPGTFQPRQYAESLRGATDTNNFCLTAGSNPCVYGHPTAGRSNFAFTAGPWIPDEVIQVVGSAAYPTDGAEPRPAPIWAWRSYSNGFFVSTTTPANPWDGVVGDPTNWGALPWWPSFGDLYLLRLETQHPFGSRFNLWMQGWPRIDHAVVWERPPYMIAAKYFSFVRGMNMYGYAVDLRADSEIQYGVRRQFASGSTSNVQLLCRRAGAGTWQAPNDGHTIADNATYHGTMVLPGGVVCDRVYALVGQAATVGTVGSVQEVSFWTHVGTAP